MKKDSFDHPFFTDTDRYVKKQKIKMAVMAVVYISALVFPVFAIQKHIKDNKDGYAVNVGKRVILGKDTVQVLDYSTIKQNYTLSNGHEISVELFEKIKVE